MSSPIERTLDVLARSQDEVAETLLMHALGRDDQFGVDAVLAIGRHAGRRLKYEVVRMVDQLSRLQKDALQGKTHAFAEVITHGLDSQDESQRAAAIQWIGVVDDFARFGDMLERLPSAEEEDLPLLIQTLEALTDRMFDHIHGRDGGITDGYSLRNGGELRSKMFDALMTAVDKIDDQPCPERLLEWGLILADAEGGAVTKLFSKLRDKETKKVHETLMTSVHPGILRLPLDLMKRTYPFDIVFEIMTTRVDESFVHALLRDFPQKLTQNQQQNLLLIETLPWLTGDDEDVAAIPECLHVGLTRLIGALGLPTEVQQNVLRWLLNNGDSETREAASAQFDKLDKSESHTILRDGLAHEDTDVQVWATSHLRGQEVPDAFALLIARLDSDIEDVKLAARKELHDLNLQRALTLLETAPARVTPAFGVLLKKVNPDLSLDLRRELAHAIRGRRAAAIRVAVALGMSEEVTSGITVLVEDADMLVRRTAVEALGQTPTRDALVALQKATNDKSPRVREAAVQAIQQLRVLIAKQQMEAAQSEPADSSEVEDDSATDNVDTSDEVQTEVTS